MSSQVWVWVRDTVTGHRYDVSIERLPLLVERGAVEEVFGYPRAIGKPRPAKPRRPIPVPAPQPTKRAVPVKAAAVADEPKESESS